MPKFIELLHHDIQSNKPTGKRIINVDAIVELEVLGDHLTRIHLIKGDHIDVSKSYKMVRDDIKSLVF